MGMEKINFSKTTFLVLFLAVGFMVGMSFSSVYAGIPWGTSEIADNAITSEKIKNRQVKSPDIKNNAVKSNKIRDGTITGADIADGSIQLDDLSPLLKPCPTLNSLGFVYEGTVTDVFDPFGLLGGGISVGETIRGFYCYDPITPDTAGNPENGFYVLKFISISIGNDAFDDCSSGRLVIFDNVAGRDGYDVDCFDMSSVVYSFSSSIGEIQLSDFDQTIFVDDSLPQLAPDLNEFEDATFRWSFATGPPPDDDGNVDGTITSLVQVQ